MLRRLVIWSSRGRLLPVYRALYHLLIRFAGQVLGAQRGVEAVYLTRGCAKDEIEPGVSDIDFIVITSDDEPARRATQRAWRRLARATGGLIDYHPVLAISERRFFHLARSSPYWRYRFLEGKATWKLLHGRDFLPAVPRLTDGERRTACYAELHRWWFVFAFNLLGAPRDAITRNVACYKAVGEVSSLHRALAGGEPCYSRAAALAGAGTPLAGKLADLGRGGFLSGDDGVADETFRFLVGFFVELWRSFAARPFLQVDRAVTQSIDCPDGELEIGAARARHLAVLREHVRTHWGELCRGARVVKSASWGLDDLLLVLDVDEERLPAVAEIAALTALHARGDAPLGIFLFLRVGPVAFPLTPEWPIDLGRALLTPGTTPEVFLQLGSREVYWTDYSRWYLCHWETNDRFPGASDAKQRQLRVIAASAGAGRVIYPLTRAAVARAAT